MKTFTKWWSKQILVWKYGYCRKHLVSTSRWGGDCVPCLVEIRDKTKACRGKERQKRDAAETKLLMKIRLSE